MHSLFSNNYIMARKVFISVLGAGLYKSCKYANNDFCSSETNFIQYATLNFLKANKWSEKCKAYILLTDKARKDNWDVVNDMRYDYATKCEVNYKGLHKIISEEAFPFPTEDISIPDGKDEKEMWEIFETVYNLLEEEDELYLDLTHSFRYLPMLILVLGNYAKFLKRATVCSLTYGNYEAKDPETNIAPIVNLLPLSSLQDWTFATADFLKNGYADRLVELSKRGIDPLMRNEVTRTDDTKKLRSLVNLIDTFSMDMRTCRGLNVIKAQTTEKVKQEISVLQTVVIPQLKPVFQKLMKSVECFEESGNVMNSFKAAQWCYDNQQYQQATTFLEEGVISFFCVRHNIGLDDRKKRELVTSAFFIATNATPREEWRVSEKDLALLEEIVNDGFLKENKLLKKFNLLIDLRNDYNHCGMRKNVLKPTDIKIKIKDCLETIIPILYPIDQTVKEEEKPSIFINFSNHPSTHWNSRQLSAASVYGEIQDMPFPHIDPEISTEAIKEMAQQYVEEILSLTKCAQVTVHVMGEMVLVYSVVSLLKENNIRCVASTTNRDTWMTGDGKKISDFEFVKFRDY